MREFPILYLTSISRLVNVCLVLKKVYIFILNPKIDLQLIFSPIIGLQ
jgi:hypothetical protein